MIVSEARKYMRVFPELEWLYIGQLPVKLGANSAESVTVLSERERTPPFLNQLFGYAGKYFVE